jgi:CheY-like chemotaxis protein
MATILVIDDEPTVRNLLYDILTDEGHHVVRTGDGVEGFVCLKTIVVDLILCDIMMPNMDGITFATRLRADPRYGRLPLVMMSAAACQNTLAAEMYTAFLEKPFTIPALLSALDSLPSGRDDTAFLAPDSDSLPTTPAA